MITEAINRIEKIDSIENVALNCHVPSKGIYVIVGKNFDYKIISKERFSFNSKYVVMDFYSKIIELNKAVDNKKLITSNNYLTFFCKNIDKLTSEKIDNYYNVLETPKECLVYRDWIKENINKISKSIDSKEIIKVFFLKDIGEYIELGKKYLEDYILSNKIEINGEMYGTSNFINLNSKKPYLKNESRKNPIPNIVDVKKAIKHKYFTDILTSLFKLGYNILYVLETGKMIPVNMRKGELPKVSFTNGFIFVYEINSRGKLVILDMDVIPKYDTNIL